MLLFFLFFFWLVVLVIIIIIVLLLLLLFVVVVLQTIHMLFDFVGAHFQVAGEFPVLPGSKGCFTYRQKASAPFSQFNYMLRTLRAPKPDRPIPQSLNRGYYIPHSWSTFLYILFCIDTQQTATSLTLKIGRSCWLEIEVLPKYRDLHKQHVISYLVPLVNTKTTCNRYLIIITQIWD